MKDKEEWKLIPDSNNVEVSTLGNFRRGDRCLTPKKSSEGYLRLSVGGSNKCRYVHRLVAKAFIPNPNNYPQVNHKNGKKSDNRVCNLEWVSNRENSLLAQKLGLLKNPKKARRIVGIKTDRSEIVVFESQEEAGRRLNCNPRDINKCLNLHRRTSHGYYWKYYYEVCLESLRVDETVSVKLPEVMQMTLFDFM